MKTTIVKSVIIENLFEEFSYDINYGTDDNVLIITGPNGFGKTQILNILFNLFNRRFHFFQQLVFDKITVKLSDQKSIKITKKQFKDKSNDLSFVFYKKRKKIEIFNYSLDITNDLIRLIERHFPFDRVSDAEWIDDRTGELLSIEEIVYKYGDVLGLPSSIRAKVRQIETGKANNILDSINVHLIKEQRLYKKVKSKERKYRNDKEQTIMTESIQTYAYELREHISKMTQESYLVSQNLDSSYPTRLISERKKVSKEEYDVRFDKLLNKQQKLNEYGLYEINQKVLSYSQDDSKALLVYLNDLEEKLSVFDDLLEKFELFTSILNDRRFSYKKISIDREKGFYFKTNKGKKLKLNQLSSGEQHEVVLLYELIFKTKPGILVLIDEPEISLHITWQKEFLEDLLKIVKLQNFQVLIATHSPSIINDRWDLVYNLEKTYV